MELAFQEAFYIKLGRGGRWEPDSIKRHRLRIGWKDIPLKLISEERWPEIRRLMKKIAKREGLHNSTADYNALKRVCESSSSHVWVTFHKNHLWWGRLAQSGVRQDKISKYRRLKGKWSNKNLKGEVLTLDQVPGTISKVQGFRATVCRVKEIEALRCLLLGKPSETYNNLMRAVSATQGAVASAIRQLHWKDFETLVDLLFLSRTGWRRRSQLGETMKGLDLELEDLVTRDVYHVQVKSEASLKDFKLFSESRPSDVRRSYFIVHSPENDLRKVRRMSRNVEFMTPENLATLVVQTGLVDWVANRVRYAAQG